MGKVSEVTPYGLHDNELKVYLREGYTIRRINKLSPDLRIRHRESE